MRGYLPYMHTELTSVRSFGYAPKGAGYSVLPPPGSQRITPSGVNAPKGAGVDIFNI